MRCYLDDGNASSWAAGHSSGRGSLWRCSQNCTELSVAFCAIDARCIRHAILRCRPLPDGATVRRPNCGISGRRLTLMSVCCDQRGF